MALRTGYVFFDDVTGDELQTPDAVALDVTGDISVVARIAAVDIDESGNRSVLGKYATAGNQRSYWLYLSSTTGTIKLATTTDGAAATLTTVTSSAGLGTVASDGEAVWIRVDLDVDNGASDADADFYYSTDATNDPASVSWTALGTTQNPGSTLSIHAGTATLGVGGRATGADPFHGGIYRAQVYNGLFATGTLVFDWVATEQATANTWTEQANSATVTGVGDSWTFVPTWNPDNFPILATAEAFWFAGDGNGAYGPNSVNPWADLSGNNHYAQLGATAGSGDGDEPTFTAKSGGVPAHYDYDGGDFHEIADADNLDLAAAEDVTVLVHWRIPDATPAANSVVVGKKDDLTNATAGWALYQATGGNLTGHIADGTNGATDTLATTENTFVFSALVRDATGDDDIQVYEDGTGSGSPTTDPTTATLANALPMRIGASSNATPALFLTGDVAAVVVIRSVLTDTQIANLQTELETFVVGAGSVTGFSFPFTVRPVRAFLNRVRTSWVEPGHTESTDPDADTTPHQ